MMTRLRTTLGPALLAALGLAFVPACVGNVPAGDDGDGDPSADAAPDDDDDDDDTPDAGGDPDPVELAVSGQLMDYEEAMLGGVTGIEEGAISTDGLTPPLSASSGADGAFTLDGVPPGSVFYTDIEIAEPAAFRPTRSTLISVVDEPVQHDLYAVSDAFVQRNYNSAVPGVLPVEGTAITIVHMYRNNGTPLVDVPLENVALVDALGEPVLGVQGPFFFNLDGIMDPAVLTSIESPVGVARVGFLDVPPGTHQVTISFLNGQGELTELPPTSITTVADGATLASAGGQGDPDGGGGGGGGGGELNFVDDIYPDLQRASQGGLGCAICHTAAGQNPAVQFDLPAADAYAVVVPALVDLVAPIDSLLLTNPLLGNLEPHPNKTFASIDDLTYQKWLLWIEQGAIMEPAP